MPLLIGVTGFEPATPASLTQCSTKLSHTPIKAYELYHAFFQNTRAKFYFFYFALLFPRRGFSITFFRLIVVCDAGCPVFAVPVCKRFKMGNPDRDFRKNAVDKRCQKMYIFCMSRGRIPSIFLMAIYLKKERKHKNFVLLEKGWR